MPVKGRLLLLDATYRRGRVQLQGIRDYNSQRYNRSDNSPATRNQLENASRSASSGNAYRVRLGGSVVAQLACRPGASCSAFFVEQAEPLWTPTAIQHVYLDPTAVVTLVRVVGIGPAKSFSLVQVE